MIEVNLAGGLTTMIDSVQSLVLDVYVPKAIFDDSATRTDMSNAISVYLNTVMKQRTISITDAVAGIKAIYGSNISSLKIYGLGGSMNLEYLYIVDEIKQLSIKKKLILRPDGILTGSDDITYNFIST